LESGTLVRAIALIASIALFGAAPPLRLTPIVAPAVTVLLFHQVSDAPVESANGGEDQVKKPWLAPAAFDALLSTLEARGFTYVTLARALAILHGDAAGPIPAKPLLLTFDDGYVNADSGATPILRRHHATAVMFFEGRLTDTNPARLGLAELRAMQASGVWEVQSHGWAGHSNVTIDASGTKNPYWYANLAWLPELQRRETVDEYEARVRADLAKFRSTFEPALGPIHVFAYPSGEFGQNGPLPPGGDPRARLEAGHSDTDDLTPHLFAAVRAAGYDTAFAVSIPGDTVAASPANDPLAYPRLGVGEDFSIGMLDALAANGIELPEIVAGHFVDPGPIAARPDGYVVGAAAAPELFALDPNGRVLARYPVPALTADRAGHPPLVAGLVADASMVTVVQQAGAWPGGTPQLTHLRLSAGGVEVVDRRPLSAAMNWLVGIARFRGRVLGMSDAGVLFDVEAGTIFGRVPTADGSPAASDRFAGPLVLDGKVAAYDRVAHALLVLDDAFAPVSVTPLGGDLRAFTAIPGGFAAVDASDRRHVLVRWRVAS
jgi:peptidoglycan/xylan/chitin deacetylase (PgdA/CDA1 family)